jgi:hypothetical protein
MRNAIGIIGARGDAISVGFAKRITASTSHALTTSVSATQPARESKRYVIIRYCIGIVDTQVKHYPGGLI